MVEAMIAKAVAKGSVVNFCELRGSEPFFMYENGMYAIRIGTSSYALVFKGQETLLTEVTMTCQVLRLSEFSVEFFDDEVNDHE